MRPRAEVTISVTASADEQAFFINGTAGYGVKPTLIRPRGEAFDRRLMAALRPTMPFRGAVLGECRSPPLSGQLIELTYGGSC